MQVHMIQWGSPPPQHSKVVVDFVRSRLPDSQLDKLAHDPAGEYCKFHCVLWTRGCLNLLHWALRLFFDKHLH